MKQEVKKLLILNLPYLLFVYLFDKIGAAIRLTPGADASEKLLQLGTGFAAAFSSIAPSLHPADLLIGVAGAVIIRLAVYMKGKNAKKYRNIVLIYTHYVNSLRFVPEEFQLLPVDMPFERKAEDDYCPKIMEPDAKTMIHMLLPEYLASLFAAKLTESKVSEQASRRSAMDKANDNADELIEKLTIEYNKARQGAITQEITEVVSGAKAQQ